MFGRIIVNGGGGDSQKAGQFLKMTQQVTGGFSQTAVGFNLLLIPLLFEPTFQLLHDRSAVLLVKGQPLVRVEPLFFGQILKMVDLSRYRPALSRRSRGKTP